MDQSVAYPKQHQSHHLENIEEEHEPAGTWAPVTCVNPPETPVESMEFLARSWSLSSLELSKALTNTNLHPSGFESAPFCLTATTTTTEAKETAAGIVHEVDSATAFTADGGGGAMDSELLLLQRALDPDFLANQQLLKHGLYKSMLKGKMMGRWLKDQKEKRKQETRTQNAQVYAAMSVAGVAAAVAAMTAAAAMSTESSCGNDDGPSKTSTAVATAAALVASHCVEVAEEMGADHGQILTAIRSAVNIKTNGDIMALTAGAATALRGAATLRARQQKGHQNAAPHILTTEQIDDGKRHDISSALNFIYRGGELLKRTRKGDLHWKQVSFYINSNWQVIAKMKSKYMVGTLTKKKKCMVSDVECDIPSWPGREREQCDEQRSYFAIKTGDRLIEFECRNKCEKQMWITGIRQMLQCRSNLNLIL